MNEPASNKETILARLAHFSKPDDRFAYALFVLEVVLLVAAVWAGYLLLRIQPWLVPLTWIPAYFIFGRMFVTEHDCGHRAYVRSKWGNAIIGQFAGLVILIPFSNWRHIHNIHHQHVGKLGKRQENPELWTMTKDEFQRAGKTKRAMYFVMRSMVMRLLITPVSLFVVARIPYPGLSAKEIVSVLFSDLIYLGLILYLFQSGLILPVLLVYFIPLYLFYFTAVVIFYLQHQHEETYWAEDEEWNVFDASIKGSSYIDFGRPLQWLFGNVGYHHLHHLAPGIPFYHLDRANSAVEDLITVKAISFWSFTDMLRYKIWDKDAQRLISFREAAAGPEKM